METMHKNEATTTAWPEDNDKGVYGITKDGQYFPWMAHVMGEEGEEVQ